MDTIQQYDTILNECRQLFLNKVKDYGTSWRVLRPISIVDQIYIKAWRIRNIQQQGAQLIDDSIESEFIGIVNYGIIALIQSNLENDTHFELAEAKAEELYNQHAHFIKELMLRKNHDYGEAWRLMSQESMVDLILTKLLRLKQIIHNQGQTIVSEGADANFCDIVNYAVFALILLKFPNK